MVKQLEGDEMVKQPDIAAPEGLQMRVWRALSEVRDPEIPPCSITDLGIVEGVAIADRTIHVDLLPTFVGCPALDVIREDVTKAVENVAGDREVVVRFVYSPPWTSDRITPAGREALRAYGLTPPGRTPVPPLIPVASLSSGRRATSCPYCGSDDTALESSFGPTLCRTTHFCRSCRNPFEAFKPKGAR